MCCNTLAWDLPLLLNDSRKETKPASLVPFLGPAKAARTCLLLLGITVFCLSLRDRRRPCCLAQPFRFFFFLQLGGLCVGHVTELLHAPGILFGGEDQVVFRVESDSHQ